MCSARNRLRNQRLATAAHDRIKKIAAKHRSSGREKWKVDGRRMMLDASTNNQVVIDLGSDRSEESRAR
jgi:hypothetical protein